MFIALSRWESEIAKYVNKAVMMAPITVIDAAYIFAGLPLEPGFFPNTFNPLGVYAFYGPNWKNDLEAICANLPEDFCGLLSGGPEGTKASILKDNDHYIQNYQSGLFAEYSDDFENDKGKVYDLESINQVPISLIASPNDKFCPPETVLALSKRLSTLDNYVTIEGEGSDHLLFGSSNNKNLVRAL